MRAHQPGSTPIDIPETVPNPAYTPAPAPAPERAPTKVPEKVPEKVISGIAEVTATSNGGLNSKLLIWPRQTPTIPGSLLALAVGCSAVQLCARPRPPGTEFLDAETKRQKSPFRRANDRRDQNPGIEWPEIPAWSNPLVALKRSTRIVDRLETARS
jgi:hypothetical protein